MFFLWKNPGSGKEADRGNKGCIYLRWVCGAVRGADRGRDGAGRWRSGTAFRGVEFIKAEADQGIFGWVCDRSGWSEKNAVSGRLQSL